MRTIVKELCGKERVLKLGSRQKAMYENLTGKSFFSDVMPSYTDQVAMLRSALSFSDKRITEEQTFDIIDEIGDAEFFKIIAELMEAVADELEGIENAIPTK